MTDKLPALPGIVDINALFEKAVQKDSPLEVLREVIVLRRQLKEEAAEEAFNKAMTALQAELPIVEKDHQAGDDTWTGFAFAPLETIIKVVQPLLTKHGFSFTWDQETGSNGSLTVICWARHEGGHKLSARATAVVEGQAKMNKVQATMSTDTYCARRAFQRVFGIVTKDEDNDGGPPPEPITEVQLDELIALAEGYISTYQTDAKEITKIRKAQMRWLARAVGVKGEKPEAADIASTMFEKAKEILTNKHAQDKERREKQ